MKQQWIAGILLCCVFAILLNGCANKPDTNLEAPSTTAVSTPNSTDKPEPSGTGAAKPTDPVPTEAPSPTDPAPKPTEAPPAPTEVQQPKPTEPKPPKPTEPKPTQPPQPKPTDPPQPKPTEPSHRHSYAARVVAPTCTEQGYTLHKCSCGASYTDSYTNATGHSYTDTVVAATCTSKGYTQHTCSICGSSYQDNYTERKDHFYGWEGYKVVVPSTCTTHGSAILKCTMCGREKVFDGILDTVSHSYVESINSAGQRVYTCSVCGGIVNLDYWIEHAKDVAREMGFIVSDDGEDGYWGGWDTPEIVCPARVDSGGLEKAIGQALNYYKNDGVRYIWVWAKPNPYTDSRSGWYLYIGYAHG